MWSSYWCMFPPFRDAGQRFRSSYSFISSSSTHHQPPCQFVIKFTATFNTIIMIHNKLYSNLNSSHTPFWASVKPHVLSHHPATESENKLRMQFSCFLTPSHCPPCYWTLSLSQRTHKLSHNLFENATQTSFVLVIFIKIRNASGKQQHLLHCSAAHPLSPPTSGLKWDRQSGDSAESQLVKHPFCSLLLAMIIWQVFNAEQQKHSHFSVGLVQQAKQLIKAFTRAVNYFCDSKGWK